MHAPCTAGVCRRPPGVNISMFAKMGSIAVLAILLDRALHVIQGPFVQRLRAELE